MPNTTAAEHRGVKITGDSMVSANNPLTANNEIGVGRDITASIPGGFSAAGSFSGNLRPRAAAVFAEGAVGPHAVVTADATATPKLAAYDDFELVDINPFFTIEKKVGSDTLAAQELMYNRYTDCVINTFNIAAPSASFATYSAGVIACGESYSATPIAAGTSNKSVEGTPWNATTFKAGYDPASDQILAFHGGRINLADSVDGAGAINGQPTAGVSAKPAGTATFAEDDTFMSFEVDVNNNVQSDEYTIRPSRFLRSLTQGIRSISVNITQVFTDFAQYQQYTYGAAGLTTPGYSLYMGAVDFFLGNWQIQGSDRLNVASPTGAPAVPQGVEIWIPKLAFSGFPIALSTGRITVTTTAQALKPGVGNALTMWVRPTLSGFDY